MKRDPMVLSSKYSQHPVLARAKSSDLFVFDQIFVDREYRCLDELHDIRTIIDAGANVGYSSAYLLTRYPQAKVIAIEPDGANFALLEQNLAKFGDRVHTVQGALWSEDTTLDFSESFQDVGDEWARQVGTSADGNGAIPAMSIASLLDKYGWDNVDLLKMDIEGAEETVFSSPDLGWMDRVGAMVIEIHGPACRAALDRAIERRSYDISYCEELTVCMPVNQSRRVPVAA